MPDLSNYVIVGRYDLPEPTRTAAPANNLLAQEASAVTYDWDTNTLFVMGDGGTSITQVSLTGQLIDTMTLAPGSSPQGTDFFDTESITYVGNGKFVFTEERYRQINLVTYAAGTTITHANVQTVDLGTDIGNIGLEGVTYDPFSGGYVLVKETGPEGIFQTNVDWNAGTATNGSPTTVNSIDLFNPALAGLNDFSDVYALSSNAAYVGTSEAGNLLILSQESGKIVEVDRSGNVLSSLALPTPTTASGISLPAMTVEGMTMGPDGTIYLVSEQGGGDFDHPQLWVLKSAASVNIAPTAIALTGAASAILENTSTAVHVKVADIAITDDGIGTNNLTVSGADAASFEIVGTSLYLKAGVVLDYETKSSFAVTVNVDDPALGSAPDASTNYTLKVTNVVNEAANGSLAITEVAPWSSGIAALGSDWFELTNTGGTAISLVGYKMDDNSYSNALAAPLSGIASIGAGESVIFLEVSGTQTAAAQIAAFKTLWFGGNVPAGLQIGTYTGSGVGLSTSGDAVNVFDSTGALKASVTFGATTAVAPFVSLDNAAEVNSTSTTTHVTIATASASGTNGAFVASGDASETGSPGTLGGVPAPVNHAPTALGLSSEITTLVDNTSTAAHIKVADVVITDDGLGVNTLTVSGADAAFFDVDSTGLYLKAGTVLDASAKSHYAVTVNVDDVTVGSTPDASTNYALDLTVAPTGAARITEVAPWSSGNSPVGSDWFEVTNTGNAALDVTGWKMDDNSYASGSAAPISGVSSIAAGESVLFIEVSGAQTAAAQIAAFKTLWFGGNVPAGLQIGTYTGTGVGLSTGGDAVNLFDAGGTLKASVTFGASPASAPFGSFDNSAGLNSTSLVTHQTISALSQDGVNGAFTVSGGVLGTEIASPGRLSNAAPALTGAQAVLAHGTEDTGYTVSTTSLVAGYTDANGDALSVTGLAASNGTVTNNNDGTYTVAPSADFNGAVTLSYSVSDGRGGAAAATLGYTVDPVNDAPVITSNGGGATAAVTIAENTAAVTTVTASDPEGDAVTYSISGGADAALFTVNASTGALNFAHAPNFEIRGDADNNNIYEVTVSASDGSLVDSQAISVTVSDVADTHSSKAPYLLSSDPNVTIQAIITTGDAISKVGGGTFLFGGTPDGMGMFDNGDGTVTVLINHELAVPAGTTHAYGAIDGSYVSQLVIDKATLSVISGQEAIQTLKLWDNVSHSFFNSTLPLSRFCSADLAPVSGYFNATDGLGTTARIFMTGEESGSEGKQLGVVITGPEAGTAYELPWLGKFSHENAVANAFAQDKTIVMGTDDAGGGKGQVYVYVGTKTSTGTEVDKAGLTNGVLYGFAVTGLTQELESTNLQNADFTLAPMGDVSGITGAALDTASNAAGVTNFLRPEDIAWDPSNAARGYFVVTDNVAANGTTGTFHSRLYQFTFTDITHPELGGKISAVLDGTEGQVMFDNITVDAKGIVTLCEDPGNNVRVGRVWQYDPSTDHLSEIAHHDPALFLKNADPLQPGYTPNAATFLTQDEESSGVLDVTATFGDAHHKAFLIDTQNHAAATGPNAATLVEGGQLMLITQYVNTAAVLTGTQPVLAHGTEDTAYTVSAASLLAGYADAEGDTLSVSGLGASNGAVVDNGNGTFTITPTANFNGAVTLSYNVVDGQGGSTAATLGYTLDAVNDAPTALALSNASVAENSAGGTVVGTVTTTDVDDSVFHYTLLSNAGGRFAIDTNTGVLTVTAGASLDYETAPQQAVDVQVTDAAGATYHQVVTIAVTNVAENFSYKGTAGNDTVTRSDDNNWTITTLGGVDVITLTGTGNDVVTAGAGNDIVSTGAGNDIIYAGLPAGYDAIDGGSGFDQIIATANNTLIGLSSISGIEAISSGGFSNVRIAGTTAADVLDFSGMTLTGIVSISGGGGIDTITGSAGDDVILGGGGNDVLNGSGGNDTFQFGAGAGWDAIDGGSGFDTIVATAANIGIGLTSVSNVEAISSGGFAGVTIKGSTGGDTLDLSGATLTGIGAIDGGAGNDTIIGSAGNDSIIGGSGADILTGGAGNDTFIYVSFIQSKVGTANADHITDLAAGDVIDLSAIDANSALAGNQAFTFIGNAAFSGLGQIRIGTDAGHEALFFNISGNASPEMEIILENGFVPIASNFIL